MTGKRNKYDELLVENIRCANMVNPLQLLITDARPFAAAVGNKMAGAGLILFSFPFFSVFFYDALSMIYSLPKAMRNIQNVRLSFWTSPTSMLCVLLSINYGRFVLLVLFLLQN